MGTLTWIVPGTLLTLSGILALMTPERLGSSLPLLKSDRQPVRHSGYVGYGILLLLFLAILFIIGMISLNMIWTFSVSDFEPNLENAPTAEADRALTDAAVARSMGLINQSLMDYDRAIKAYDSVIEKDPTNAKAWIGKATALSRLGRYNESLKSYENYIELNKADSSAWRDKAKILKALGRDAEAEVAIARAHDLEIERSILDLKDNDSTVRASAAEALGEIKDKRVMLAG